MPSLFKTISFVLIFSALSLVVFPVMAQLKPINNANTEFGLANGGTVKGNIDLFNKVRDVVKWVLRALGLAAIVAIMYGGFKYIFSGGDEKAAGQGKQVVMYAIIGLILVLLAAVIVNSVLTLLV